MVVAALTRTRRGHLSELELTLEADAVNIRLSATTATRLDSQFDLESLGPVAMKNRGPVDAFRLVPGQR